MYDADTIAAIATPPGAGGIGIIRVSGPLARQIAERIFVSTTDNGWESHRLHHGRVVDAAGRPLDEALAAVMRAPHSYTGEDVLELHCHGSPIGLRRVLHAVLAHGARLAEPGEFTRRAFLNGRLDLAQAEAVVELIRARNDAGAATAADQLFGRLSRALTEIREALIDVCARLEVQIDFGEEEITIDQAAVARDIERARHAMLDLLASYQRGKLIRDGLRVAIVGKPNVGKSSLLNALLNEDRAIVTAIPGTTRDVVEETADFDGVPVVLSDTAGLRQPCDPVEEIGVQRAKAKIGDAEVVIVVFDASRPLEADDVDVVATIAGKRVIAAMNKNDLPPAFDAGAIADRLPAARVVSLSALTGSGLDQLRAAVLELVAGAGERPTDSPIVTLARHRDALEKAAESLRLALEGAEARLPPEIIAVDLQSAADHVGSITGAITSEDVLDRIFAEFCIGK